MTQRLTTGLSLFALAFLAQTGRSGLQDASFCNPRRYLGAARMLIEAFHVLVPHLQWVSIRQLRDLWT